MLAYIPAPWILWVIIHHKFIEIPGFMTFMEFHDLSEPTIPTTSRPAAKRYTSISACLLSCRAEPRQGLRVLKAMVKNRDPTWVWVKIRYPKIMDG